MTVKDPYEVLGVERTATAAEIRRAYRRLAKAHHPDANSDDRTAEGRFKDIGTAYAIIGDDEQRRRYDNKEIDEQGNRRAPGGGAGAGRNAGTATPFSPAEMEAILASIFGTRMNTKANRSAPNFSRAPGNGADKPKGGSLSVTVDFCAAVLGTTVRMQLADGRQVDVKVPPGTRDGQVLRLRSNGQSNNLLTIHVRPDERFRLEGYDVMGQVSVNLAHAVMGGKVSVETIDGAVLMTIPKGCTGGRLMRLNGRGVPRPDGSRGDHLVRVDITIPRDDPALEAFVRGWSEADHADTAKASDKQE